jgi:hypothetical protein
MNKTFQFGQNHPDYAVPVLNERAVRASAGILFFMGLIAFMNAWLVGNFQPTRVFVLLFLMDFGIRIFINPQYAPSLIVGPWFVRKQQLEYVGAPQKRFAWAIGFGLALVMASQQRQAELCKVPDFAKAIGHEDKWKLHNNCA